MPNIPIKINNAAKAPTDDNRPAIGDALKKSAPGKVNRLIWLLAALLIIAGAWLAYLILTKEDNPFADFIPRDAVIIARFKSAALLADSKALKNKNYSWPPFIWAAVNAQNIINNNGLNWLNEKFSQTFDDEMAFILLSGQGGSASPASGSPRWAIFADLKISGPEFNSQIEQLEKNLKQRYNLITELYRQTKITRIKHLDQNPNDIYYANLKNYLLIANDLDVIKKTVDKIMD